MVLTKAIQSIECTWVRELDNAQNDMPGQLNGYEGPYHDFNGITSKFGAHFILKVDKILMKRNMRMPSSMTSGRRKRIKGKATAVL